ncbi:MAG: DUF1540 domain-containing protein [Clostridium sp.]
MITLSCGVFSCANNEGGLCGAQLIKIEGNQVKSNNDIYCANYMESNFINEAKTIINTNYVGEIMQIISGYNEPEFHPTVKCYVSSCFYNGNGNCEARSIMIGDKISSNNTKGICETYQG